MRRIALAAAVLALACAGRAAAQEHHLVRPPRALLRQLHRDLDEGDDCHDCSLHGLAAAVTAWREDIDGDGVPEWWIEEHATCGHNCEHWIYRRLPDGRYGQIYTGWEIVLEPMRSRPRSHGWPPLQSIVHWSCCEAIRYRSVFDGRRYVWRDTRFVGEDSARRPRTIYHVYATSGPARLLLDATDAAAGVRMSARYAFCRRGTRGCAAPELRLSSPRFPAGRACLAMHLAKEGDRPEYRSRPDGGWCGVTRPDPSASGRRLLVLHPRPHDWARLATYTSDLEITGPGAPGRLPLAYAQMALMSFAIQLSYVYPLPCPLAVYCR